MPLIRKDSLSFKITIQVLAITLLLFLIIISLNYYFARKTIKEAATENAIHLANNTVGNIEQILRPMEKIPQMVASLMEIQPVQPDSLYKIIEAVIAKNDMVYGAAIAFEPDFFPEKGRYFSPYGYRYKGGIQTLNLGNPDYEYFYMDWYQIPAMIGRPYWTEPYYDEGGGEQLMSTYSVPFYTTKNGYRQFAGIATVDLDLQWLTDIVSKVNIFESGYAFMLSQNGVAVTHPDRTMIMNKSIYSNSVEWNAPVMREIGRDLRQGISRFREYNIPGYEKRWIYYRNLNSNLWAICVVFPDSEMFASLHGMSTLVLLLFIGGLILLTLITAGVVNHLSAPLELFAGSARTIAEGQFDSKLPAVSRTKEMKELHDAFSHMQEELARYVVHLKETTVAKEKIESELRIAREIQLAMIPHSFPPFPDLPQVDLYAMLKSAKEVGGDLYDFFVIGKRFYFSIGDVSGKGVPASLFMAVTRTLLRSIADKHQGAADILGSLNRSLAFNNESNMFVTFFLGIFDLESGKLTYANAGHNPPVLIRNNNEVSMFEQAKAIPLGLFSDFQYGQSELFLNVGDKIFAYTDGVSEAENQFEELFGEERMLKIIQQNAMASPRALIAIMEQAITDYVKEHPQSDDITILTIKHKGND